MKYREYDWRQWAKVPLDGWRLRNLFTGIEYSFGVSTEVLIELMRRAKIPEPVEYLDTHTNEEIIALIDTRPKATLVQDDTLRNTVYEWFESVTSNTVDAMLCEIAYRQLLFWGERNGLLHAGEILEKMKNKPAFEKKAQEFVMNLEITKAQQEFYEAERKRNEG
jgi:hypothetical protein